MTLYTNFPHWTSGSKICTTERLWFVYLGEIRLTLKIWHLFRQEHKLSPFIYGNLLIRREVRVSGLGGLDDANNNNNNNKKKKE